ncbi:MFS transporter [Allorhizocola rhizosphaerae]|uniref:MFS transporter n=1 Tax=Allorhizocola rhizosphaerae TaxID=1872709 RepID=UPI000E3EADFD|nr:MFS transporter [Allorhizocola rhizosphaerae]
MPSTFRLLLGGLFASMTAESILVLALAIWVKDLTGSSRLAGLTIFAVVMPMLLAPLVGWVVDRFPRRPFLVVAHVCAAAALTPLFVAGQRVWIIFTVAVLYGLSYIAVSAALNGLIKLVVPGDRLASANGALQAVKQGLRLIGPVAGAGLYTAFGGAALAVVGVAGFLTAAVVIFLLPVREKPRARSGGKGLSRDCSTLRRESPKPVEPWLTQVGAGLRHVGSLPVLRRTTIGVAVCILMLGFNEALVFAYVDEGLGLEPGFVGVLATVQAFGGLLGGLAAARLVRRLGETRAVAVGMLAFLPAASFSFVVPSLWLVFPGMVVFGFGASLTVVGFNTLLQRSTPQALMGRVTAATDAVIGGPAALATAAGALAVSVVDFRLLFACTGLVLLATGAVVWVRTRQITLVRKPFGPQNSPNSTATGPDLIDDTGVRS